MCTHAQNNNLHHIDKAGGGGGEGHALVQNHSQTDFFF